LLRGEEKGDKTLSITRVRVALARGRTFDRGEGRGEKENLAVFFDQGRRAGLLGSLSPTRRKKKERKRRSLTTRKKEKSLFTCAGYQKSLTQQCIDKVKKTDDPRTPRPIQEEKMKSAPGGRKGGSTNCERTRFPFTTGEDGNSLRPGDGKGGGGGELAISF